MKQHMPNADPVQVAGMLVESLEGNAYGMALDALLELQMKEASKNLDFEETANLCDRIKQLCQRLVDKA